MTLNFSLVPPVGEAPNGSVEWSAEVFGPEGVAQPALMLVTSGAFGEQLALAIPAALVGQVVLRVRFPSTSGKTVIGTAQVVHTQWGGRTLAAIEIDPESITGPAAAEIPLRVRGRFSDNSTMPIFTAPADTTYQSLNSAVATVDAEGRVALLAVGATTIVATHAGTLQDSVPVSVLDALPMVVTPALISGTVGQALVWQLAASQVVTSFAMGTLPPGLTLDGPSGLIQGTPTAEGRYPVTLTVENANGRGSKLMEFVIAGVLGNPTSIGLDGVSVRNGQLAGWAVGRLSTGDPNPLDTFTYQLVSGTGSTDNALFAIAGDQLVTASVLNLTPGAPLSIRVRTTDSSGAIYEKALALAVGQPPAITRQPEAQRVFTGDTVTFSVQVSSAAPVTFAWFKDGAPIAAAVSQILELSAASSDAGSYTVLVANGSGAVASAGATLIVDPVSYGRWAAQAFGTGSGPLVQPDGDYDRDGIPNFLDFAFGVQPGLESGVGAQPRVSRDALGYVLTYREANGVAPLTYRILKSVNLGAWVEHVPAVGDVTRTILGTFTQVEVRVPGPNPGVFFKVRVEAQ